MLCYVLSISGADGTLCKFDGKASAALASAAPAFLVATSQPLVPQSR